MAAVGQFFNSWAKSIRKSVLAVDCSFKGKHGDFCAHIDPRNISQIDTSLVLTSIGYGYYSYTGGSHTADPVMNLVTRAIEDTPDLAEAFWSTGFTGTLVSIANIIKILDPIARQFQDNLQNTLSLILGVNQTGVSHFLSFTSTGRFTTGDSLRPRVHFDIKPFNTFLLTSALTQNNWTALMLPSVEPLSLQSGTVKCPAWAVGTCKISSDIGCHREYDSYDRCYGASWWYSRS